MSAPSSHSSTASTTTSTGIAGSQRAGQATATAGRNANRGIFRSVAKPLLVFLTIVLPLLLWWSSDDVQKEVNSPPKVQQGQSAPQRSTPSWYGVEQQVTVTSESWSELLRFGSGQCIRYWTANPEAKDIIVQVRGVNDPTWYEWDDFLAKKAVGALPFQNPGWMRFKATGNPVVVRYEFRNTNECN